MSLVNASHLVKKFGSFTAVDDISLDARPGEIVGILGVNGAGKTTLMRMLTGYLKPTSGSSKIASFGYMPEGAPLYPDMTVRAYLSFLDEVYETSGLLRAVTFAQLTDVLDQKIDTLSKGFKRRVALAATLIHDPSVLLLDEPTEGLDPNQKEDLRDVLKKLSAKKAVLLSTHILEEVRSLCTRAVLIHQGKIVRVLKKSDFSKLETYFKALKEKKNEAKKK